MTTRAGACRQLSAMLQSESLASRFVTPLDVLEHLDRSGILSLEEFSEGNHRISDVSRRNLNFAITDRDQEGFLVKAASSREHASTLARETRALTFLNESARTLSAPGAIVGGCDGRFFVQTFVPGAQALPNLAFAGCDSPSIARQMAATFGRLSKIPVSEVAVLGSAPFPSAFTMDVPTVEQFAAFSPATIQLTHMIQGSTALCDAIEAARRTWSPAGLVHGDLRPNNIVLERRDARGRRRLLLVDWEFAGLGDPMWDRACLLAHLLHPWMASEDTLAEEPYRRRRAERQLRWARIVARHVLAPDDIGQTALVSYLVARLLQILHERSANRRDLKQDTIRTLQVAENLARQPAWLCDLLAIA